MVTGRQLMKMTNFRENFGTFSLRANCMVKYDPELGRNSYVITEICLFENNVSKWSYHRIICCTLLFLLLLRLPIIVIDSNFMILLFNFHNFITDYANGDGRRSANESE